MFRNFYPNKKEVIVELLTCRCDHCGESATLAAQQVENRSRLDARKSQYGAVLMGEAYLTLRKRYGLTRKAAATIFGKGVAAFSRYEREAAYPDVPTRLLVGLAMDRPDILKALADRAGVAVPLWQERCEDALGATAN